MKIIRTIATMPELFRTFPTQWKDQKDVRVDKSVFSLDKDVLLIASLFAPENSPLYDTLELKDGILILEQSILQIVENEDPYILLC